MGIIVFIIIVVLIILSAARKGAGQTDNGHSAGETRVSGAQTKKKPEAAGTQNAKAARRQKAETARKQKAETARKHMTEKWLEEESLRKEGRPEHVWKAAGVEEGDGMILASAKLTSYAAEKDNEENSQEDLLGPVYDLMVKGPDTSIAFERDFLAEGMDMLNKYN